MQDILRKTDKMTNCIPVKGPCRVKKPLCRLLGLKLSINYKQQQQLFVDLSNWTSAAGQEAPGSARPLYWCLEKWTLWQWSWQSKIPQPWSILIKPINSCSVKSTKTSRPTAVLDFDTIITKTCWRNSHYHSVRICPTLIHRKYWSTVQIIGSNVA